MYLPISFFRYSRPNGEQIDEFEIEDDTHQTIGRCRCLESHTPTEEAIATSGHLAVERWFSVGICKYKPGYKSHDQS